VLDLRSGDCRSALQAIDIDENSFISLPISAASKALDSAFSAAEMGDGAGIEPIIAELVGAAPQGKGTGRHLLHDPAQPLAVGAVAVTKPVQRCGHRKVMT
jgi:hypothetical protein